MPIFYSQFLRDDNKASLAACEVSRQNVKENTPSNNGQNLRSSFKGSQRSEQEQQQPPTPPSSPSSRLVWHNHKGKSPNLKTRIISAFPFQYKDLSKKKTVHFASIEVQTYHCDHSCDEDVFIAKEQIVAMNKQRFKDASISYVKNGISSCCHHPPRTKRMLSMHQMTILTRPNVLTTLIDS